MKKNTLAFAIIFVLIVCAAATSIKHGKSYIRSRIYDIAYMAVRAGTPESRPEPNVQDIRTAMARIACEETAQFVIEHMDKVPSVQSRFDLLDLSLASVDPALNGLYCEFGVASGVTINHIASKVKMTIHGFDSFEGLPETWRTGMPKGAFAMPQLPAVRTNVQLYKGWFNESLPPWAKANSGPIAFLHLDADLYSSTKTVLDILGDRIVAGTVIQFDEYFNYPSWKNGEFKAFKEFVEARKIEFEYLGYNEQHEQVAVKILRTGSLRTD